MKTNRVVLGDDYELSHPRTKKMGDVQLSVRNEIIKNDRPDDYEFVSCICGNNDDYKVLSEVERHGLPYRKLICMKCGLLRVSPRWSQKRYDSFYQNQYRDLYNPVKTSKEEYVKALSQHEHVKGVGKWIMKSNEKFGPHRGVPRILEIGAGGGWNLNGLPGDWIRTAYDVDDDYLEIGKRLFNIDMKYGLLDEASTEVQNHDIVVLSHVVEHFLDPVASLQLIAGAMTPDSLLLIEVPGLFRIHRTNLDPMTYMQNAHTYTFTAFTLKYVCLMAGLRVLAIDESCRVICIKDAITRNDKPVTENSKIAPFTIEYLQRCNFFYNRYSRLKKIKLMAPLAYVYKKLFIKKMDNYFSANSKDFSGNS